MTAGSNPRSPCFAALVVAPLRRALAAAGLAVLAVGTQAQSTHGAAGGTAAAPERAPAAQANWLAPENLRGALRGKRRGVPTATVRAASAEAPLPMGKPVTLDALVLQLPEGRSASFDQYLADNQIDALLVLHRGRVVYERYFEGMDARDAHAWASMSKSLIGLLAAQLIEEGRLEPSAPLARYVPELADTPLGQASVQRNLDMEVALAYPPQLPPDLGLFTAAGLLPARAGMPDTIQDFLRTATRPVQAPHGSLFYYQNAATEAVAWALQRVTGRPLAALVSERIWRPMGAQDDAEYSVDRQGTAFASGGLFSTLRDVARFGELVRNQGRVDGRQAVSAAAVARIRQAPSAANQQRLAQAGRAQLGYGNFWWHPMESAGALYASGRFGQRLVVDPTHEITIAQFGAYADTRARSVTAGPVTAAAVDTLRDTEGLVALARAVAARVAETNP